MEITLNKKKGTEGSINIKLGEADYQMQVEKKLGDYAKKASIKGFRPGKVPAGVVKKMFGKSILVEEINHILSHKLNDYIKEQNLKILGEPLPNLEKSRLIDWDNQKDFEFEYEIGIVEDFKYELSDKVKVKSYPIELDKKIVDDTLEDLRKRFGKVEYPETSAIGDNVYGDLREKDGEFKREYGFIATDKVVKKEQKTFVGLKKEDEVEFDITKIFDDLSLTANLLGVSEDEAKKMKGTFVLKINTISRTEPAEVNQELFDRVFGKDTVKDEEEFINKIKETVGENYKRETQHFLEHHIEDYYIKNTSINLPEAFLKKWLQATSEGKVTEEMIEKEFDQYKRSIVWDLVRNKIAEDHKIVVDGNEVKGRAKEMIISQFGGPAIAEQLGDRLDAIADNYLQNENGKNFMNLYSQLRNDKIMKLIRETIKVDEKKVSVDEFKKVVEEHTH
ncbi:trigger factor [Chryseotalea sanaruensis]|uniref:Trigger factor n=1 Tax=Chryseotalea sanaruensis TaxID=2482724 RepID=A0A401UDG4_9BACT|nr:trigger factor [Chryseotalea sanaruensis]GCC52882.1 trigger factor [Chryseotalea sanaruensis]